MQVAEKTHARLGPSGWDRWSNCPGSAALCDGLPNKSSFYAAEGSVAHELADMVLRQDIDSAGYMLDNIVSYEGYDIKIDQEMVDAVDLYESIVTELGGTLLPEQQLPIGHLTGEPGATGTTDAVVFNGNRMTVIDFKYGKGVRVSAVNNGQGRMYALGALEKFGMVYDIDEVEIMIIQPRVEDGISSEILSIGELEEFRDLVELAAARTLIDGDLVPGEKQCKFCDARGICPALKAEVSESMALVSTVTAADFADLTMPKQAASIGIRPEVTSDRLAEFLRAVPLIEAAIAGVRGEVERRLFDGQDVPGFYLGVGKRGNRQWADQSEVEAALKRKRIKVADIFEKKLVSPAKAEKLLKGTKAWDAVSEYITQSDGRPSVCQDGDKNPVYVPVRVTSEDFADLTAQSEAERLLS